MTIWHLIAVGVLMFDLGIVTSKVIEDSSVETSATALTFLTVVNVIGIGALFFRGIFA